MSLSTADSLARGRRPEASGLGGGFGQTPQDSALPPPFLGPLLQGNLLLVGAQLSWQELQPRCLCKDQPTLPSSRGKAAVPRRVLAVVSLCAARQAVCAIQGV